MRLLFIFLIACFSSCSVERRSSGLLVINLDEISYEPMDVSAIADSVAYIQFDNSFILPGFASLHWADSCFFANTREGVLKYDTKGRFLCKIGDIGDGPEEYPRYYYRCIMDKANEVIYIYSYAKAKLLSYSFSGEFIKSVQVQLPDEIKRYLPSFACLQGKLIYFYYDNNMGRPGERPFYWLSIRKDGTLVESYRGTEKVAERDTGIYGLFYAAMNDSTVVYYDLFEDTIYHVTPHRSYAAYLWGQGDFRLSEKDSFPAPSMKRRVCTHFFDTRNFLLFQVTNFNYQSDNVNFLVFLNKKTGSFSKVEQDELTFDKRTNINLFPLNLIQINGREYFICQTNSAKLMNFPELIPWGIDPDDAEGNPVLALVRLKE